MAKRIVLRVEPTKGIRRHPHPGWVLSGRFILGLARLNQTWWYPTQADAIKAGRRYGRIVLMRGRLAQLVVHKPNGKIRFENTYGRDPRRHRG